MSFLPDTYVEPSRKKTGLDLPLLHKLECKVCPLNKITTNKSPHMPPTGSKEPVVYVLGEAPDEEADKRDRQFVGPSGELFQGFVPTSADKIFHSTDAKR